MAGQTQVQKKAAEKLAAEKEAAEKLAAEKLAAEKEAAEKLAAEKLAAAAVVTYCMKKGKSITHGNRIFDGDVSEKDLGKEIFDKFKDSGHIVKA